MKKNTRRRAVILGLCLAMAGALLGSFGKSLAIPQKPHESEGDLSVYRIPRSTPDTGSLSLRLPEMNAAFVERIVDGDTIVVSFVAGSGFSKPEKIRLIGVDTPETVDPRRPVERFGAEASRYAGVRLSGKKVYTAFEQKLRDNYGRLLAYVFLEDGTCINLDIVVNGYGFAYTKHPFYFMDEFRQAEKRARDRKIGLWGG